jgi:Mg-chelatase subunit ChlD
VLVIDRSGSMTGVPIAMARTAVQDTLRAVGPDDCLGVIAFDGQPRRLLPFGLINDRTAAEATIAKLDAGGGTEIVSALTTAFDDVRSASGSPRRSIILFTDGQSARQGIQELIAAIAAEKVTVSAVGLGSGVDEPFLQSIVDGTGGRLFLVNDPAALPEVVGNETRRLSDLH